MCKENFHDGFDETNQSISEAAEIIDDFEHKSGMQFKAISNYFQIHKLFYTDIFGNIYYPEEYSGSWINGEDLYVALTSTSDEIIKKYRSDIPFSENIRFVKMKKALNELELERNEYLSFFSTHNIINSSYIDVKNNKCVFEVINIPVDKAYKVIQDILLSVDPKFSFSTDDIIIKQGFVCTTETNIIGGMEATSTSSYFTVGVCGKITMPSGTEYNGFCTSGHGQSISDTIKVNNKDFGILCLKLFANNSNGDYALVRMTSTDDILTNQIYGSSTQYIRYITSSGDDVPVDAIVMKYGKNSGYATGKVTGNNVSMPNIEGITIKGLTACSIESGTSAGGDSGGPYYIKGGAGNNYTFVGVHHGQNSAGLYFTPYVRFKTYFSPKTSQ